LLFQTRRLPLATKTMFYNGRPTRSRARDDHHRGSKTLDSGVDLVFGRTFEGWSDSERNYFEVNQEYTHLADIHWRPERKAYCRFDDNGDLADIVSISPHQKTDDVSLISFNWRNLEDYLAVADFSLVRMFDFTLLRRGSFSGWPDGPEEKRQVSPDLFFRQKIGGNCGYTRGVQIIRPRRDARTAGEDISSSWSGRGNREHTTFVAYDWRNKQIAEISTAPGATTNYFEAAANDLPFELSPAFFRPEVLSKYKTDREKYTVSDREIRCRASWSLRGYDVNAAGQVHAYICDLRALPYGEQLHWKTYNEPPKESISERAFINDFKGEFVKFAQPRSELLSVLRRWRDRHVSWWTLRDDELLDRANPPLTTSKDEWAEAIMDLSKLVVEGFETKALRKVLEGAGIEYSDKVQSIALLEKIVASYRGDGEAKPLEGLRSAQRVRSKVKGHSGSSEGKALAQEAVAQHGSFAKHFDHTCRQIVADLEVIEAALLKVSA
jgi:hypothetical protein